MFNCIEMAEVISIKKLSRYISSFYIHFIDCKFLISYVIFLKSYLTTLSKSNNFDITPFTICSKNGTQLLTSYFLKNF